MTRRQVVALFGVTLLSACGGGGDAAETVDGGVSGGTDEPGVTADAVVALAVAPSRLCVVTRDRTVRCGARDADGVPGDLEPIAGLTDIVQLSLGEAHGCALDRAGAVWCFGDDTHGQLAGAGTSETPVQIELPGVALTLTSGARHSCASVPATEGGRPYVYCWGDNRQGQLGRRSADVGAPKPVTLGGLIDALERPDGRDLVPLLLASGPERTCVGLDTAAAPRAENVACWGAGITEATLLRFPAEPPVRQLSVGDAGACALGLTGRILCDSALLERSNVLGRMLLTEVMVGRFQLCGVREDARLVCAVEGSLLPLEVASEVALVATFGDETCALDADGEVVCVRFEAGGVVGTEGRPARPAGLGVPAAADAPPVPLPADVAAQLPDDPPVGGELPPVGGDPPPVGGDSPPAGGETPPAGGAEPPIGGAEPPPGGVSRETCRTACQVLESCGFPLTDDNDEPLGLDGCTDVCLEQVPPAVVTCVVTTECATLTRCFGGG
jgi:hypothetical protein